MYLEGKIITTMIRFLLQC